jgi:hypothetical protein
MALPFAPEVPPEARSSAPNVPITATTVFTSTVAPA